MNKNTARFLPLLLALAVIVGIIIGSFYANQFSGRRLSIINTSSNKITDLFHLIDDQYVDTVNIPNLVEKSMPQILKELDPHSSYISAKDVEMSMQELDGKFSGIGVQFTIYKDTVRIVHVVKGGPSENSGLRAGDRIVAVDGKPYVGKEVTNEETLKRLKGSEGTTVKLGIVRAGEKSAKDVPITRGVVPVKTIDAAYMADDVTGYIRITSFGENTYAEFLAALAELDQRHMQNLVIDLRGNLGGYMEPAVQIANEFLPANQLIVYTEGRRSPRQDYHSDGRGTYQQMPLFILVDESSASASEILSGAMQDNDRATIIGRRTFGKGLVQVPIEFNDGSMLRLTKARYYTPSGRCVQKPYTPGDEDSYAQDLELRSLHGEYYNADSIKATGEKYKTRLGRTVYGGGGIIPDVFIPKDTTGFTTYFKEAYLTGLLYQYAYVFVDTHRKDLETYNEQSSLVPYLNTQNVIDRFATFAANNGLQRRNLMIERSSKILRDYLYSNIISNVLDINQSAQYLNAHDEAMLKALQLAKGTTNKPVAQSLYKHQFRSTFLFAWMPRPARYTIGTYAWRYAIAARPVMSGPIVSC
ncbi:MAG: S41 family peptidase [Bacteroidales bacterium]|nr:S41 family peptidase [Bacteroidales bacterium]